MPCYKIIGDDQQQYGPVSAEQIRQWMREGRVDTQTRAQAEGTGGWKRLSQLPEFAAGLPASDPSICPTCGEPFVEGFDSCWRCGTGKDGSRPKNWVPAADGSSRADGPCPKCGSHNVKEGSLLPVGRGWAVMFRPSGTRLAFLRLFGGLILSSNNSFACLDCGLVWDYLPAHELRDFVATRCGSLGEQQAHELLAEAVRLEAQGDVAGALASYKNLLEKFPGTGAATDAEQGVRKLTEPIT